MNRVVSFKDSTEDYASSRERNSLGVMKEYVKAKVVQRVSLALSFYLDKGQIVLRQMLDS